MCEIPEEVIEKMLDAACSPWGGPIWRSFSDGANSQHRRGMRAAAEVLVPHVVRWALREPSQGELDAARVWKSGHDDCVKKAFANRLAALTKPKDAAVEAVSRLMPVAHLQNGIRRWESIASPEQIVAAVDEARAKETK